MGTRSTRNTRLMLTIGAGVLGAGPLTAVHAQQQGSRAALEEIVVTARKTAERLVDVPISISAFTAADIEAAGLRNVADIAGQTPGFSFNQAFGRIGGGEGGAGSRPAVRGMSSIIGSANAAFFVDGVYFSSNINSLNLDTLERVEVYRGPQSALFGRQTFAGAVNFITRKPDNEFRGQANATVGQYDRYELTSYLSGPLIQDVLFGEINIRYYDFGGDYRNAANGRRDINAQHSQGIGGKLRWVPTDNLEVMLHVAYNRDQDLGYATARFVQEDLNCLMPDVIGSVFGIPRSATRARGWLCGEVDAPATVAYDHDGLRALGHYGLERETVRTDLTVDYMLPGDWSLTSVSAYNRNWNINGFDNNLGARENLFSYFISRSGRGDFSQDLRLLSPRDSRLRGLFGVYYFDLDDRPGFGVQTSVTPAQEAAGIVLGQRNRFDTGEGVTNSAVYGLLEYDLSERLTVSAEGRFQRDKVTTSTNSDGGTTELTPFTDQRSETFTKFLPRLAARFTLSDEVNIYGSFAQGNKPGGFNSLPTNIVPEDLAFLQARGFATFDEENVDSFELGIKGGIAGNRYTFGLAVYHLDWDSQQTTQSEPFQQASNLQFTTVPVLVNAGESQVRGIEVEMAGSPTDWFQFRFSYAWARARYKDFYDENLEELLDTDGEFSFLDAEQLMPNPLDVDGPTGQTRGNKLPQTGEHQASLSTTLSTDLFSGWTGFLRNDWTFESKRYIQTDNLGWAGDSFKWNLRAGIEKDSLTVTLYVNNLLDDDTLVSVGRLADFQRPLLIPDPIRTFAGQPARFTFYRGFTAALPRKREAGVTVSYRF